VLFGFAYADIPEQAMSVVVTCDRDRAAAQQLATRIASQIWSARRDFKRDLPGPAEAVRAAAQLSGLTALANVGDNFGGGAVGDSTAIVEELIRRPDLRAASTVCDPEAVMRCEAIGTRGSVSLVIGRPSLALVGEVRRIQDGQYVNDGPLSRGVTFDMGRVAVVESGSLTLVLQSRAVMANDQNMLRSCGIDLDELRVVDLKGAAAIRAGWSERAARFLDVDTPGPTGADVTRLGLQNVLRPLWPLDDFQWDPAAQ
jgi:microcystin degradation protein MlrC